MEDQSSWSKGIEPPPLRSAGGSEEGDVGFADKRITATEREEEDVVGGVHGGVLDCFDDDEGADIFTSAVSPSEVKSRISPDVPSLQLGGDSSRSNGMEAQMFDTSPDDADDLFAEATEEVSLESPEMPAVRPSDKAPTITPVSNTAKSVLNPDATNTPAAADQGARKLVSFRKTSEEVEESSGDTFDLHISVTDPEKVGEGMSAYMAYKVNTKTTLAMFSQKNYSVKRRFSDFLGLHEKLTDKHAHVGLIVPPAPEKSVIGMTKVKVGKEDPSSVEFLERRRSALERYLQRTSKHPTLMQDPDFRDFLEKDELPRAVNTQAFSGAGILRMVTKAADAVNKMTIKINESDLWFEEKQQQFDCLDQQLRKLHIGIESLVGHRKELSTSSAAFAKSTAMLGSSEDNTALARALSQLAEVEERVEQLHAEQCDADLYLFGELIADYIRLLSSIKAVFDQRGKCWQRWQDSQSMLLKKREAEAKLQWVNKPDKLQQAKEEIHEWEGKVEQGESEFELISKTIRKELSRFEKNRVKDFKNIIIQYIESLINTQQQLIKYWEAFLPEAKAIA
uniref:Sorting nexin-2 n=1 Tax=Eptatretus burgeri TaxID=7764 RepID=A0A8C4R6V1_EPTBU